MDKIKKVQNMDCSGCEQRAIKCEKCIRKVMEYWNIEDFYTTEKQAGIIYKNDINKIKLTKEQKLEIKESLLYDDDEKINQMY